MSYIHIMFTSASFLKRLTQVTLRLSEHFQVKSDTFSVVTYSMCVFNPLTVFTSYHVFPIQTNQLQINQTSFCSDMITVCPKSVTGATVLSK